MINIKLARLKKGLSQKQLAKIVGVHYNIVSKWECGYTSLTVENLIKVSKALDISTDFLLGLTDKIE